MTITTRTKRLATLAATTAVVATPLVVATAPTAEAASWVCAYTYVGGATAGKACFKDNTAQVCDLRKDGIAVWGSFGVRNVGPVSFKDANGAASPCSYQTFATSVGSASSYTG